jgi:hypothetical protein
VHLGSAQGRARPARLVVAQPTWLVALRDGNRGRRSAVAALAVVGDSSKPTPKVGGEQALWQGGGVVDWFDARKRSEGGSLELFVAAPVVDREMVAEARTGGRGGRRLGQGATRRCTGARGRVDWGFEEAGAVLHGGSTMAAWWHCGGGGWRKEKGSFTGVGLPL